MRSLRRLRSAFRLLALGLIVAAVTQELSKPKEQRTWHGKLFDTVPYDFRVPTLRRLRDAYWNPDSDRLFSDRVFGVGWAINFYRARELVFEALDALTGADESSHRGRRRGRRRTGRARSPETAERETAGSTGGS